MTHADHANQHGEGRVTSLAPVLDPLPHRTEAKRNRFICKSCPDDIFVSARELVQHVSEFREADAGEPYLDRRLST